MGFIASVGKKKKKWGGKSSLFRAVNLTARAAHPVTARRPGDLLHTPERSDASGRRSPASSGSALPKPPPPRPHREQAGARWRQRAGPGTASPPREAPGSLRSRSSAARVASCGPLVNPRTEAGPIPTTWYFVIYSRGLSTFDVSFSSCSEHSPEGDVANREPSLNLGKSCGNAHARVVLHLFCASPQLFDLSTSQIPLVWRLHLS